jgi:cytochrome P450
MLDIFGDFTGKDPAETLAAAARGCPYQWTAETHALYAFRARDVKNILTSKDYWSRRAPDRRAAGLPAADRERRARLRQFFAHWPAFSDGEYHKRIRHIAIRLLRDTVTPGLLHTCAQLTDRILTENRAAPFEWAHTLARPLAREAVATLTGPAGTDRLIGLGTTVLTELATPRIDMDRVDAALDAAAALRDWLRTARTHPPSPLIAGLGGVWDDPTLGPEPATALLTQIVTGAYDPTVTALCAAAEHLTADTLTHHPVPTVREEIIRIATPFRFASRYVRNPVTIGPHRLRTGDRVVLCLGTANLDPDHFPDPAAIRRRDTPPRTFSFGTGEHHCPGAPLARAVIGVLLETLARHRLHFTADHIEREPEISMLRYRRLHGRLTATP